MEIATKSASIDTLAVTIQALHVSGKQMTLAVFRQLPEESAYNDDGSLAPLEYWGVVRYAVKDEGDLWVICASGGRLYRCPLRWHGDSVWKAEENLRHANSCIEWWHQVKAAKAEGRWDYPHGPRNAWPWKADALAGLETELVDSTRNLEVCQRAEATREALARLPQLFIAV